MAQSDEAELAAARLETALERIAVRQAAEPLRIDPRITTKLDNLIRALRTALDS